MNNNVLKSAITAVIKQNGNEEITGDILQQTLIAMVDALGGNYQFAGIARSDTAPGTPDQHVFYLAAEAGTAVYANFGGITVDKEICALCFVTSWTKMSLVSFDEEPTEDSGNLVSSGAIFQALENLASYVEDAFIPKVPTAVENNIATFDDAGNVKDSGKSFDAFLPADGIAMASGLIDVISAGTDQEFLCRKSGGDGVAFYKGIKGKSIVWNQIVDDSTLSASGTTGDVTFAFDSTTHKITATGTASGTAFSDAALGTLSVSLIKGHKYFINTPSSNANAYVQVFSPQAGNIGRNSYEAPIFSCEWDADDWVIRVRIASGTTVDMSFYLQIIDLTMLGLGDLTAAQFKALYRDPYYPYNPGIIKNNDADGIESEGFNRWDEEWEAGTINAQGENAPSTTEIRSKNYIPIISGVTQLFFTPRKLGDLFCYDADKTFISTATYTSSTIGVLCTLANNTAFVRFRTSAYGTVYLNDICVNISDPDRNGMYEPYWKKDIQLKLSALRVIKDGVEKVINGLDGVGSAFDLAKAGMDGYVRVLGKVMDEVDLGDLEWTYAPGVFLTTELNSLMKFPTTGSGAANGLCDKYGLMLSYSVGDVRDKVIYTTWQGAGSGLQMRVRDSAYSDADTFKAAMQGVKLRFELATPIHYELVEPFFAGIMVDEDGTEKAIAPSGATTPSAPFVAQTTYTISIPNLVKKVSTI